MIRKLYNISAVEVQTRPRLKDKEIKLSKFLNKSVNVGSDKQVVKSFVQSGKTFKKGIISHYKTYLS